MRMFQTTAVLAVGALSLAACGTTMTERAATGGLAGAALGAATTPRTDNVNRRQYYDERAGRYYFYDPATGRYYWENGQPRY